MPARTDALIFRPARVPLWLKREESGGKLLEEADALADAKAFRPALERVERVLAVDLAAPGAAERWRRWGALAREAALGREALTATKREDVERVRRELRDVARVLEESGEHANAALGWTLAAEESARLRLLARPHVCESLVDRIATSDARGAGIESFLASWRAGRRREALTQARSFLANHDEPRLVELAAVVLTLSVRGPRIDVWLDRNDAAPVDPETPAGRLLASERIAVVLGTRVTMGRIGADVRITGPGVAPEHLELRRDTDGAALLADLGTVMGTTLAGARLAASLPVGGGLTVELGARVPVRVAPMTPARGAPLVVEAGGALLLAPLGELRIGERGDVDAPVGADPWTLVMLDRSMDVGGSCAILRAPGDVKSRSSWAWRRTARSTSASGTSCAGSAADPRSSCSAPRPVRILDGEARRSATGPRSATDATLRTSRGKRARCLVPLVEVPGRGSRRCCCSRRATRSRTSSPSTCVSGTRPWRAGSRRRRWRPMRTLGSSPPPTPAPSSVRCGRVCGARVPTSSGARALRIADVERPEASPLGSHVAVDRRRAWIITAVNVRSAARTTVPADCERDGSASFVQIVAIMRTPAVVLAGTVLASFAAACANTPPDFLPYSLPAGDPDTGPGSGSPADPGQTSGGSGLPCEVVDLLAAHCTSCHSPAAGTPPNLVDYDDLVAPSAVDPSRTEAERSLLRIQDASAPMPPADLPLPPAAQVSALAAWIDAGMPEGTCGGTPPTSAPGPYDTPTVCSSDVWWTDGDEGSTLMLPGQACVACHETEGPRLLVGGTVYPTAHEPDDCFGAGGAVVRVVDDDGKTFDLPVNAAGNFFLKDEDAVALAMPIHVEVVVGAEVRPMVTPSPHGDCNACHTEQGTDAAPGRVMLP